MIKPGRARRLVAAAVALVFATTPLLAAPASAAAGWHQRGPTISSGSVAIGALASSASGNVVAFGEEYWSSSTGRVLVYRQVDGTWDEFGVLEGASSGDRFGMSLAMNAAGTVLVVGAAGASGNTGYVKVYKRKRSGWVQDGATLTGSGVGEFFGYDVHANAAGNVLALTATSGVKVYRRNRSGWAQVGAALPASNSVSLNNAGNVIAVGNYSTSSNAGSVAVYRLSRGAWVQVGPGLSGSASNDYFGIAVDLNKAGNVLAVGASGVSGGQGAVTLYRLAGGSWLQQGSALLAENQTGSDQFGGALALDAAGKKVTIGAYCCGGTGYVKQYQWGGSSWVQRGATVAGPVPNGSFGASVASSSNGNVITASVADAGSVQQYRYNS